MSASGIPSSSAAYCATSATKPVFSRSAMTTSLVRWGDEFSRIPFRRVRLAEGADFGQSNDSPYPSDDRQRACEAISQAGTGIRASANRSAAHTGQLPAIGCNEKTGTWSRRQCAIPCRVLRVRAAQHGRSTEAKIREILVLRDYIKATVGFEELGADTGTSAKSLIRMFGARGNPQARNFFAVLSRLQERAGLRVQVTTQPRRRTTAPTRNAKALNRKAAVARRVGAANC